MNLKCKTRWAIDAKLSSPEGNITLNSCQTNENAGSKIWSVKVSKSPFEYNGVFWFDTALDGEENPSASAGVT